MGDKTTDKTSQNETPKPTHCPTCAQELNSDFWKKTDEQSLLLHNAIFSLTNMTTEKESVTAIKDAASNLEADKASSNKLLIDWRPQFDIGIKSVDDQHQKIAQMINVIHLSLKTHSRKPHFIPDLISDMDHYVKEHFSDEENLMRKMNYPGLAAHHIQHQEFINEVQRAHEQFKVGFFDLRGLLKFVVHWFMDHSQGTDREFGNWVKDQNNAKESA